MEEINRLEIRNKLDVFFYDVFEGNSMDRKEWDEFLSTIQIKMDRTFDQLVDDIIIGINNGHSIDVQFGLMKNIAQIFRLH